MSMTKEQFFEEISQLLTPTEAEIETQYYWEMARRRQFYIDHITEQIMAMPESHWFSADFEAWMYEKQKEEIAKTEPELFIARRNDSKPTTDMDFDIPPHIEDANHQKRNANLDNLFN